MSKLLAAIGITCFTKVDRRSEEGGTQKDVVLEYTPKKKKVEVIEPKPIAEKVGTAEKEKVVELKLVGRKPSWRRL